jgi:predicted nucleotidyltransferase
VRPFTSLATPPAEARVSRDLDRITAAVRTAADADPLLGIFLLGGYARGEGAIRRATDGTLRGFNDYDLLLVFADRPASPERYAALSRRLARELEIDFVDLGVATLAELTSAPPTLFWYELGEGHRELWVREGARIRLPRFRIEELDPEEGSRLLLNRGMALLWAALRLWPEGAPGRGPAVSDPAELRFAAIAAHKAILAAGDAALLRSRSYHISQEVRRDVLRGRPELRSWAEAGFLEAYDRAVEFRREPRAVAAGEAAILWQTALTHHRAGFRAAEEVRFAAPLPDWKEHARRIRGRARRRAVRPREAARVLKRSVRGGNWLTREDRFFLGLPRYLYTAPPSDPAAVRLWRDRALALVREWHP